MPRARPGPTGEEISDPSLAVIAGTPWVAWDERVGSTYQVRVARYVNGSWVLVSAESINVDASHDAHSVELVNAGGSPYLLINQRLASGIPKPGTPEQAVYVRRFDGTNWIAVGGPLNLNPFYARGDALGAAGGVPYAAVQDPAPDGETSALRVWSEEAPSCQAAIIDVAHDALTGPITLNCDEGVRRITGPPSHGTLSDFDVAAGTIRYTPSPGFTGADSFTFVSSDGTLESAPATVSLNVAGPPGEGGGGTTLARPTLTLLRRTRARLAVGKRTTTFSFRLNVDAKVTVAIQGARAGRRVAKRCLAPTRARRRRPRCLRFVTVATLTRSGHTGVNRITFTGRIGRRALPSGSYRAVFYAENAAGRSPGRTSGFTIMP
jgi:Big-like domain-containing protein